jgi:hypothetical protein
MADLRVVSERDKWLSLLFLCDNVFIFLSRDHSTIHKNQAKEREKREYIVGWLYGWLVSKDILCRA